MYKNEKQRRKNSRTLGGLYKAAYKKFYIDEIYLFVTKKIIFNFIGRPAAWIDKNIVDGFMNGIADITATISSIVKRNAIRKSAELCLVLLWRYCRVGCIVYCTYGSNKVLRRKFLNLKLLSIFLLMNNKIH